jgi:hypothetical protein
MSEPTLSQVDERQDSFKDRLAWGWVAQYIVMQLGRTIPYAPLVWLAYLRR